MGASKLSKSWQFDASGNSLSSPAYTLLHLLRIFRLLLSNGYLQSMAVKSSFTPRGKAIPLALWRYLRITKCIPMIVYVMQGYLMKKGRENNQFLPRKFVLSEIDNTIKYYVKVGVTFEPALFSKFTVLQTCSRYRTRRTQKQWSRSRTSMLPSVPIRFPFPTPSRLTISR